MYNMIVSMLLGKIQTDQLSALKARDQEKLNILRYILAQINYKKIDKKSDLTDDEIVQVLRKVQKELDETIESAKQAKREDLRNDAEKQKAVVTQYLPKEISDEEVKKEIEKIIGLNKAVFNANKKAVIGIVMKELRTKASSQRIIQILQKEYLK